MHPGAEPRSGINVDSTGRKSSARLNLATSRSRPTSTSSTPGGSSVSTARVTGTSPSSPASRRSCGRAYDAIERGTLTSRIADAELTTANALLSSPKKRRLMR